MVGHHHGVLRRLSQAGREAEAGELVAHPLRRAHAIRGMGGLGGDGGNAQPLHQPAARGLMVGVDVGEELAEVGHR
jgi:hypothetical protein